MTKFDFTFEEVAIRVGRFEMETTPSRPTRQESGVLSLDLALSLGLFESPSITACVGQQESKRVVALLQSLGHKVDGGWKLSAASPQTREAWIQLLRTDQVLVFEAPQDIAWLAQLVGKLFRPFVATLPSMSLSEAWLRFERKAFTDQLGGVHVSCGGNRTVMTFVGTGDLYAQAVAIAAQRPPLLWGYTAPAMKDALKSRKLVFRETKSRNPRA